MSQLYISMHFAFGFKVIQCLCRKDKGFRLLNTSFLSASALINAMSPHSCKVILMSSLEHGSHDFSRKEKKSLSNTGVNEMSHLH